MEKVSISSKNGVRRGVSLPVLIFTIIVTATLVSGIFLLLQRHTETNPAQSTSTTASTAAASKPSAATTSTPGGSSIAAGTVVPASSPESLTNEQLFKLKAPSVVLLQIINQYG